MTNFQFSESTVIHCPAEQLYDIIADNTRMENEAPSVPPGGGTKATSWAWLHGSLDVTKTRNERGRRVRRW